jgi:hypothetical protein
MVTSRAACHYYRRFLLHIRHLQAQYTQLQKCHYKDCLQAHNKCSMVLNNSMGLVGVTVRLQGHIPAGFLMRTNELADVRQ